MKKSYRILNLKSPEGKSIRIRAYYQVYHQTYFRGLWTIDRTTLKELPDGTAFDKIEWSKPTNKKVTQ